MQSGNRSEYKKGDPMGFAGLPSFPSHLTSDTELSKLLWLRYICSSSRPETSKSDISGISPAGSASSSSNQLSSASSTALLFPARLCLSSGALGRSNRRVRPPDPFIRSTRLPSSHFSLLAACSYDLLARRTPPCLRSASSPGPLLLPARSPPRLRLVPSFSSSLSRPF